MRMGKITKVLLAAVMLLALAVQPMYAYAAPAAKTVKIKVTLQSVKLISNDHVGNDWVTVGYVNGKEIKEGKSVVLTLKPSEAVRLKAYAEEQDKVPDIGTKETSVKASAITKKTNKGLEVTVKENRGRYSGNTAKWKFTFTMAVQK